MLASFARSPVTLTAVVSLGAAGTLLGAWWFQYVEGYVPCKLCLLERWPYYFGIPIATLALVALLLKRLRTGVLLLIICAGIFLWSAGLGGYHAGVEWGWFVGPSDCGGGGGLSLDAGGLLGSIENTRLVSCNEASWRLIGLSFAGWNAVVSVGLAGLSLLAWRRI